MSDQPTATSTRLPAGTWTLDPEQTEVSVAVKKLGFIEVEAELALIAGQIVVDADGNVASVDAAVAAGSYTSGNDKRDTHVRSADFLDAESHPEIRFSAGPVESTTRVAGTVSVKGTQTPVAFDVRSIAIGDAVGSFTADVSVDRRDLGVDKLPSFVIANDLRITVSAHSSQSHGG